MIFETPFETAFDESAAQIKYKTYSIDSILANLPRVNYDLDALLKANVVTTYRASARIGILTPSYQADAILVLDPSDPRLSDSFINALMWAFANEWRKAARAIELLSLRMKLDYANTDDLDDYWGLTLGLRRKAGESDDDFRTRLAIRVSILTSSGTKANCQAVIDRITGAPGGSRLDTFGQGEVVLSWTSPDAIIAAQAQSAMITEAMDQMIAAGVTWSTSYPLVSYDMDVWAEGNEIVTYDIDGAISKLRGHIYYMASSIWESGNTHYHADGLLYSTDHVSYQADTKLLGTGFATYQMASKTVDLMGFWNIATYEMDALQSKGLRRSYMMGGELT